MWARIQSFCSSAVALVASYVVAPSTLALFCGSHVADESRLRMLRHMLRSWKAQSHPVELWLSISAATDALKQQVHAEVTRPEWGDKLRVFVCRKPYAQFEHLQYLTARYAREHKDNCERMWVCFTDDDDTFGSQRMRKFMQLTNANNFALEWFPWISEDVPFVAIDAPLKGAPLPMTQEQEQLAREESIVKCGAGQEYTQYCVRLPVLRYFFEHTSPELLQYKYADLFFQRFLHRGNREAVPSGWKPRVADEQPDTEYAYWERPGCGQARAAVQPRSDDGSFLLAYLRSAVVGPAGVRREDYWRWVEGSFPTAWQLGTVRRDDALLDKQLQLPLVQAILALPSFIGWRIARLKHGQQHDVARTLQREFDEYIERASLVPVEIKCAEMQP